MNSKHVCMNQGMHAIDKNTFLRTDRMPLGGSFFHQVQTLSGGWISSMLRTLGVAENMADWRIDSASVSRSGTCGGPRGPFTSFGRYGGCAAYVRDGRKGFVSILWGCFKSEAPWLACLKRSAKRDAKRQIWGQPQPHSFSPFKSCQTRI
jgi:hypothetical protein